MRKVKKSLAVQWKLQLLTVSLALPNFDTRFNLKAANMKKVFEKRDFYLDWFDPLEDLNEPQNLVWLLCQGVPKIRACQLTVAFAQQRRQFLVPAYRCFLRAATGSLLLGSSIRWTRGLLNYPCAF